MPVPQITAAKFLESLERSGLVSDVELQSVVTQFDGATDEDAHRIARELVNRGGLTRYQAERLLAGESRGFFINRYRLLELLGAGGMSYLYLATDPDKARRVALKVVTRKYVNDEGMITRLKLEARAGQTIDHPNVVKSYEISAFEDVFGPNHYLAMEFVEGVNLEEFVQLNRTIPWSQVCDMGMQAGEGLRAAHRANVVHRDVKPANLLVDREGRLKLLDFGLALLKSREETDEFSLAMIFGHDCLGTADFIAPEQSVDSLSVDARADIYSLGCTLYALFAERLPFPETSSREKIEGHRNRNPPSLADLVPGLPAEVAKLVGRMMAKQPNDRPQSMDEVITSLGRHARRQPIEFDFSRILAYRASQARKRKPSTSASTARQSTTGGSSRAISHWTTSPTRVISQVSAETAHERAASVEGDPNTLVALSADPAFGAAVVPPVRPFAGELELTALDGGPPIRLKGDRVSVGRNPECDVIIAHKGISGKHCEFRRTATGWSLVDLKSKNGVQVNDRPLSGSAAEVLLQPGDRVTLGRALNYRFPGASEKGGHRMERRHRRWGVAVAVIVAIGVAGLAWYAWRLTGL